MACLPSNIIRAVEHDCGYHKGGVSRIWISLLEGNGSDVFGFLDGWDGYEFFDNKATGERYLDMDDMVLTADAVAALGADATTFVEVNFNKRDESTVFTEAKSIGEDGYGHYEPSITIEIPNMNIVSNPTVAHIVSRGLEFVAIVETNVGDSEFAKTYHFVGKDNGLMFLDVSGTTGAQYSDKNIYTLQLKGFEDELSYIIKTDSAFSYGSLPAPIAVVDPETPVNSTNNISADFTVDFQSIYEGDRVSFTDLSSPNPISWNWNFGDTNTATAQNPDHQYTSAGSYDVSLSAENDYTIDVESKSGYITVAAKTFVNIGTYAEPTGNALAQVNCSPLQRVELELVGVDTYGDNQQKQNLFQPLTGVSGTGDVLLWMPDTAAVSNMVFTGDCITVDFDAVTANFSGYSMLYADYASGSISMLNNLGNNATLTAAFGFTGNIDFDSWNTANSFGTIKIVGGTFSSTNSAFTGATPTLSQIELRPSSVVSNADVDDLIIKLATANWTTSPTSKYLKILGSAQPRSAASDAAVADLNNLGVTVTTN